MGTVVATIAAATTAASAPHVAARASRDRPAVVVGSVADGRGAYPGRNGRIAFVSGVADIALVAADGSGRVRLTSTSTYEGGPAWSPDGRRIAYSASRDASDDPVYDLYTMNADGSDVVRLTTGGTDEADPTRSPQSPTWSPDGRRIAYAAGLRPDVWVMNADGTAKRRITRTRGVEFGPAWSPDGRWLACARDWDIWLVSPDGRRHRRLTRTPRIVESDPDWSPDGRWLAFQRNGFTTPDGSRLTTEIVVMRVRDGRMIRLTRNRIDDVQPAWSPDGRQIVFASTRAGEDFNLFTMTRSGNRVRRLTTTWDLGPDWQPLPRAEDSPIKRHRLNQRHAAP